MDGLTVKRKRDKDKSERLDQLKHWIEKHRFHIKKLETLLRMLDNNAVDIESVSGGAGWVSGSCVGNFQRPYASGMQGWCICGCPVAVV